MAEDPKVSRSYRDLPREEPPRHVDEAILAAARRAISGEKRRTRPAPLVVPSGRRRWYFPLAAAAIIVLAVAVTIQVEREQPDPELAVAPVTAPQAPAEEKLLRPERAAEPAQPAAKAKVFAPDPPATPPPPPPLDRRESPAPQDAVSGVRESARAGALPGFAQASPEQWLQGIADLRRQGRHEEADKALAEFRRAYPQYRISEAMLGKVEKK